MQPILTSGPAAVALREEHLSARHRWLSVCREPWAPQVFQKSRVRCPPVSSQASRPPARNTRAWSEGISPARSAWAASPSSRTRPARSKSAGRRERLNGSRSTASVRPSGGQQASALQKRLGAARRACFARARLNVQAPHRHPAAAALRGRPMQPMAPRQSGVGAAGQLDLRGLGVHGLVEAAVHRSPRLHPLLTECGLLFTNCGGFWNARPSENAASERCRVIC